MEIKKLIFGGYGLIKDKDRKPALVYKSVPGDIVGIKVIEDKKSYQKATISHLERASEKRIEPKCPYFNECGGCEHQNISYENQLGFKDEIFKEILDRSKIDIKSEPILAGSNHEYYYRNVLRFMMNEEHGEICYKMNSYLYTEEPIKVSCCYLQSPLSNKIMTLIKNVIDVNLSKMEQISKEDFWQLRIREGKHTQQVMVEIMTTSNNLPAKSVIVNELKKLTEVKSIYHTYSYTRNLHKLTRNLIYGSPIIYEKIDKYQFQISPESFFQTNSYGVFTLYETIKQYTDVKINESLLDLYCGTGTIGIYLSTLAKKVIGVDSVKEAIKDAADNARINKVHNCEFITQDAGEYLKRNRSKFDKVIVDPPRAGLTSGGISNICLAQPKRIVYVSCNPTTFARDIKEFERKGWRLTKLQPIDMFPQTHHIECVGILVPKITS